MNQTLFVAGFSQIIEYDATTGAIVNPQLIVNPAVNFYALAASGDRLFVATESVIAEYTTSGATVNAALVSNVPGVPSGIAITGGDLFVAWRAGGGGSAFGGVSEYDAATGATINASLITGLKEPLGISAFNGNLYVADKIAGTVGEYTTSGQTINAALISGLNGPYGVVVVPEPGTLTLAILGLAAIGARCARRGLARICKISLAGGIVVAFGLVGTGRESAAATYSVTDLGYGYASAVSSNGLIAINNGGHAYLYNNGLMQDLGSLGGGDAYASFAWAVNDSGQVVGTSATYGNDADHAFLYSDGIMRDISVLGHDQWDGYSIAKGINNLGQVVGTTQTLSPSFSSPAFLYSAGTTYNLGTLVSPPGVFDSNAQGDAINNSGQIVGWSTAPGGIGAFLYSNGVMTELGSFGGNYSEALGISNNGIIVGDSETPAMASHAFLYCDGQMRDIATRGVNSIAYGVNDFGQAVGYYATSLAFTWSNERAFVFDAATGMVDLNSLVDLPAGWTLIRANAINDAGQIVGAMTDPNGTEHAYLLAAVPEPSTLALAAISFMAIAGWRLRYRSGDHRGQRSRTPGLLN